MLSVDARFCDVPFFSPSLHHGIPDLCLYASALVHIMDSGTPASSIPPPLLEPLTPRLSLACYMCKIPPPPLDTKMSETPGGCPCQPLVPRRSRPGLDLVWWLSTWVSDPPAPGPVGDRLDYPVSRLFAWRGAGNGDGGRGEVLPRTEWNLCLAHKPKILVENLCSKLSSLGHSA